MIQKIDQMNDVEMLVDAVIVDCLAKFELLA